MAFMSYDWRCQNYFGINFTRFFFTLFLSTYFIVKRVEKGTLLRKFQSNIPMRAVQMTKQKNGEKHIEVYKFIKTLFSFLTYKTTRNSGHAAVHYLYAGSYMIPFSPIFSLWIIEQTNRPLTFLMIPTVPGLRYGTFGQFFYGQAKW